MHTMRTLEPCARAALTADSPLCGATALLVVVAGALAGGAPAQAQGGAATVKVKPQPVGTRAVETYRFTLKASVSIVEPPSPPEKQLVVQALRYRRETTVLAVRGGAVTRLKVRYLDAEAKTSADGQVTTSTPPVKGKTYVLSGVGGRLKALRDGRPVTATELTFLRQHHPELGKVPALATLLKRRTANMPMVKPSAAQVAALTEVPTLQVPPLALPASGGALFPSDEDAPAKGQVPFTVVLKYGRAGGAGGAMVQCSLNGDASVRADGGWLTRLLVKGDVNVSQSGSDRMLMGEGKVQIQRTIQYR